MYAVPKNAHADDNLVDRMVGKKWIPSYRSVQESSKEASPELTEEHATPLPESKDHRPPAQDSPETTVELGASTSSGIDSSSLDQSKPAEKKKSKKKKNSQYLSTKGEISDGFDALVQ